LSLQSSLVAIGRVLYASWEKSSMVQESVGIWVFVSAYEDLLAN
jgi:hypothetical protein